MMNIEKVRIMKVIGGYRLQRKSIFFWKDLYRDKNKKGIVVFKEISEAKKKLHEYIDYLNESMESGKVVYEMMIKMESGKIILEGL